MTYASTTIEAGLPAVPVSFPYPLWMIQAFSTSLWPLRPRLTEPLARVTITWMGAPGSKIRRTLDEAG
jgi:hypothetical protein